MSKGRELVERLVALPPSRFNQLVLVLGVAPGVISGEAASLAHRAVELVRYFEQPGRDTSRLEAELERLLQESREPVSNAPAQGRSEASGEGSVRRAVVLTALGLEYKAVRAHLRDVREETHPAGTVYERGFFGAEHEPWEVLIVETGAGTAAAAVEAERALTWFEPQAILFVGVAGGVKDVKLGDVVVADKVYGYEHGKDVEEGFLPRPEVHRATYAVLQRARADARKDEWKRRLQASTSGEPQVFIGPLAAGEKVVAGQKTAVAQFLSRQYSDSLAVEMEGIGFLAAAYSQDVEALVVRGISDLLAGKAEADAAGSQPRAAAHAAAFAFEVLAHFRRGAAPDRRRLREDASGTDLRRSTGRQETQDDLLAHVAVLCELHLGGEARIERLFEPLWGDYLRVGAKREGIPELYPVAVTVGACSREVLERFEKGLHERYLQADPGVRSVLVVDHREPIDPSLKREAIQRRIQLTSLIEYRGLIDFGRYIDSELKELASESGTNKSYPPRLYVKQRVLFPSSSEVKADALTEVERLVTGDEGGHFVLLLGEFGSGKTFLLRELTQRLALLPGAPTPIRIEMRDLEKTDQLDVLVTSHFKKKGWDRPPSSRAFNRMLADGQIVLLFDGYDELALRVSYERAAAHFETLLQAARDRARVVATSRTQHFRDRGETTGLGRRLEGAGIRYTVAELLPFDRSQILELLEKIIGDRTAARARLALLDEVKDLAKLAANPRMLSFIVDIPEEQLREAKAKSGVITAASLYRMLMERWLGGETERKLGQGLATQERWEAARAVALVLWQRPQRTVSVEELPAIAQRALPKLMSRQDQPMDAYSAGHDVGSGTLLVRDEKGAFSFIHQSVMEWLVADVAASGVDAAWETTAVTLLSHQSMSALMVDFFTALTTRARAITWARRVLADKPGENLVINATEVLRSLGQSLTPIDYSGQDHSGRSFAGEDLREARFERSVLVDTNFHGADLRGVSFRGALLERANLAQAKLDGADLTNAVLAFADCEGAHFTGAVLQGAKLLRADLSDAVLERADVSRADLTFARLVGASLVGARLEETSLVGANLLDATFDSALLESAPARLAGAASTRPVRPGEAIFVSTRAVCSAIAFHPSGEWVATGDADSSVRLWDVRTGGELHRFLGHSSSVTSAAISRDGRWLASGSEDTTVKLWDVRGGSELCTLQGHVSSVTSVAFSPDGKWVASGSADNTVRLWDVSTGREVLRLRGHTLMVKSVSLSPDGKWVASGSADNTVRLWDVSTGRELLCLRGHAARVNCVAFSPDGEWLASGSDDSTVVLWDVRTGSELRGFPGHSDWVRSVAFSPDGKWLASGSVDNTVRVWAVGTGRELRGLRGHSGWVNSVAFSPDGQWLASGSDDKTVRLWNTRTGREQHRLEGCAFQATSVVFSPDGRWLASASEDRAMRLWDVRTGRELRRLQGHSSSVTTVASSRDGRWLASGGADATVRLWDVRTGSELRGFVGHSDWVRSVAFSPDGQWLASGSDDSTVRLWNVRTGKEWRCLQGHSHWVRSVAFSPDGQWLASGSSDTMVRLWDVQTGRELRCLEGHSSLVMSIAFSPDGKWLVSGSSDMTVRLWDVHTGRELRRLHGHSAWVTSVAFSPDGKWLVSGSADKTVMLWEAHTGRELRGFQGHSSWVTSLAFSPDGHHLAVAFLKGIVCLFDVATGQERIAYAHLPAGWAAFTPEGRYKLSGDTMGLYGAIGFCRFEPSEFAELTGHSPLEPDAPLL
ncbi:WD40 repeat protein [Archangium gephyra]|uniref:High-affnity carbon uptake protein Hat/HatR n=1 Tax=Archangium gephyra TaxID=48 RepID=A0AAC8Q039_9BACT|nr:pentapeptide repeat-containing protein [Archangium gephyra]AKI98502.1 High-affnity carbon uptake protein Hat/HatR [Archangium gephyra]REG20400.1 WD40 repeat protein [Archangium gephyra]